MEKTEKEDFEHLKELKESFLCEIEGTSDWRAGKAHDHPDDEQRNMNSSNALIKLHEHVEALPNDHALFQKMQQLNTNVLMDVLTEQNNKLSRYGFFNESDVEDPREFIDELIKMYEEKEQEMYEEKEQ